MGSGGWQAFGMSIDNELQKHYALLLGIGSPWEVKAVELKLQEKKVEIDLGWQWGSAAQCPAHDHQHHLCLVAGVGNHLAVGGGDQFGEHREHLVAVFLCHERRELCVHRVAAHGQPVLSTDAVSGVGATSFAPPH